MGAVRTGVHEMIVEVHEVVPAGCVWVRLQDSFQLADFLKGAVRKRLLGLYDLERHMFVCACLGESPRRDAMRFFELFFFLYVFAYCESRASQTVA